MATADGAATDGAPADKGTFGRLLRRYREAAGLGQERLAERAGLSAPAISNLERGVNRPRLATVALLAEALALTAEQRAALLAAARPVQTPVAPAQPAPSASDAVTVAGPHRHDLPAPPTALLGRERELAEVGALLEEPGVRLLTLSGVGGVGKTRLALAAGAAALDRYADGVWLVELAPLADPALVPGAVAGALGLREEPTRPLIDTLADHLRGRRLLLLLDNCEHLLAACADLVSALLRAGRGVSVLATSRERLGLSGERVYRVPSLDVPDPRHPPAPASVGECAAVRLFVARARARREFALTARNAPAVAEVCRRLDGIPLAIELAAARTASLPVAAIAERLDERFTLLTGGPRDALPRQQTLRATMDWSWELLGAREQALLRLLSVFAGGWTLGAAQAICATFDEGSDSALDGWALLDLLDGLVGKSLAQVDETGEAGETGGEARYGLLETVRQYALERLVAAGELEAARAGHLDWCVDLAEEADRALFGAEQQTWMRRLEAEHDNLRAALRWARTQGQVETGLRLASALGRFWELHAHLGEGCGWLERLLAATEAGDVATAVRAKALDALGRLAYRQGDYVRATPLLEQGLALARAVGDAGAIARTLGNLGMAAMDQRDYERASALLGESLALRQGLGDRWGQGATLADLGTIAYLRGDAGRAAALLTEGLALARAVGDRALVGTALHNLGWVRRAQGDDRQAVALFEESLQVRRALGDTRGMATMLSSLGHVAHARGDGSHAAARLQESLRLAQSVGDKGTLARCLEDVAGLAGAYGLAARAAQLFGAAAALREVIGAPRPPDRRTTYERDLSRVRAALAGDAFATNWTAGRDLPLARAVAAALDTTATALKNNGASNNAPRGCCQISGETA